MANQPSAGCLAITYTFGILIGLGILFGGGALLWQVPSAWTEMREVWNPAQGKVLSSRVKEREVETGSKNHSTTLYAVMLSCSYTVEGRELVCHDSPAPRQARQAGNLEEAIVVAASYQPGDEITVYYKPEDATQARLDEKGPNGMFWIGLLGGPLLILSGIGLAAWSIHDWRRASAGHG